MPLLDYHVHTRLCNHAKAPMESYVKQALALGLSEIAFLDHLTLRHEVENLSMTEDEVGLYFEAARKLQRRYRDRIRVRIGLEVDYHPEREERLRAVCGRFSFDVLTASVHFLEQWNLVSRRTQKDIPFDDEDRFARNYLGALYKMLEAPFFDVVGHLDIFRKFSANGPVGPGAGFGRVIERIAEKGLSVELNTSGFSHPVGEAYPALPILERLNKAGVSVTLGSDAHRPDQVGRRFDRAVDLLTRAGYTQITAFDRRKPFPVPL